MENNYVDKHLSVDWREGKDHRGVIGGLWDEIGKLQFDYMKQQGLQPDHSLIDIGCGSLRGGTHFIPYLNPHQYYGFDINRSLIDAGLNHEVSDENRQTKIKHDNFHAAQDFDFPEHWQDIDCALSISLFTHLTLNTIRQCLMKTHKILKQNALYHATVFTVLDKDILNAVEQSPGIVTHSHKDPYHYTVKDLQFIAQSSGYDLLSIEEFGHPRSQKMAIFKRL